MDQSSYSILRGDDKMNTMDSKEDSMYVWYRKVDTYTLKRKHRLYHIDSQASARYNDRSKGEGQTSHRINRTCVNNVKTSHFLDIIIV
jgi:ribosomal protein L32